jgi:hypothetical protein
MHWFGDDFADVHGQDREIGLVVEADSLQDFFGCSERTFFRTCLI